MSPDRFASVVLGFEKESPEALFQTFLRESQKYLKDATILKQAFELGKKIHAGQTRESGAPYLTHPLIVARLLLPYRPDQDTLVAAMLHDSFEDSTDTSVRREVRQKFGDDVAALRTTLLHMGVDVTGVSLEH